MRMQMQMAMGIKKVSPDILPLIKSGATWIIDPSKPQGIKKDADTLNAERNPVLVDLAGYSKGIQGVYWRRTPNSNMHRTNNFNANSFPYNKIQHRLDQFGNHFIRIPKFYILKEQTQDWSGIFISEYPIEGGYLPKVFWDFENNCELSFYDHGKHMGHVSGGRLRSVPGVNPTVSLNIVEFRDLARANGVGYQQLDIHAQDVLRTLFRIEFATMDEQSIMQGYVNAPADASPYQTGWSVPLQTGWHIANDGLSPCAYRGIESPWGDAWQFMDGININNRQSWVCDNANAYQSNLFTSPYKQLSYVNASANGWVQELGIDQANPMAEIPTAIGTNNFKVNYWQDAGQRIALVGGRWALGSSCGFSFVSLGTSSAVRFSTFSARLLRKPSKAESDQWASENGIHLAHQPIKTHGTNVLLQNFAFNTSSGWAESTAPNGKLVVGLKGDGADDLGLMNSSTSLNPKDGDFAIGVVIQTSSVDVFQYVYSMGDPTTPHNPHLGIQILSTGQVRIYLGAMYGTSQFLNPNTWYKMMLKRKDGSLKFFVNGLERLSVPNSFNVPDNVLIRLLCRISGPDGKVHANQFNGTIYHISYNNGQDVDKYEVEFNKFSLKRFGI